MEAKRAPLVTKGTAKVCLVLYAMDKGEQYQAISVPPKKAKSMVNQFKETGRISFLDVSKLSYDEMTMLPVHDNVELEPYSVIVSYVSDFYMKQS